MGCCIYFIIKKKNASKPQYPEKLITINPAQTEQEKEKKDELALHVNPENGLLLHTPSSEKIQQNNDDKFSDFKRAGKIGKRRYYQGLDVQTGHIMALKTYHVGEISEKEKEELYDLFKNAYLLNPHPNIMKILNFTFSQDKGSEYFDIFYDFMSGGCMHTFLEKFGKLEERYAAKYLKQILEGLEYLHQNSIVHEALKSSNILLDSEGNVKLTDYVGIKFLEDLELKHCPSPTHLAKTIYWTAPEVLRGENPTPQSDVWSAGCLFLELLNGTPPYSELQISIEELTNRIINGLSPSISQNISDISKRFLSCCFKLDPNDRPKISWFLNFPIFSDEPNLLAKNRTYSTGMQQTYHSDMNYIKPVDYLIKPNSESKKAVSMIFGNEGINGSSVENSQLEDSHEKSSFLLKEGQNKFDTSCIDERYEQNQEIERAEADEEEKKKREEIENELERLLYNQTLSEPKNKEKSISFIVENVEEEEGEEKSRTEISNQNELLQVDKFSHLHLAFTENILRENNNLNNSSEISNRNEIFKTTEPKSSNQVLC